jgi:hypothetical protein
VLLVLQQKVVIKATCLDCKCHGHLLLPWCDGIYFVSIVAHRDEWWQVDSADGHSPRYNNNKPSYGSKKPLPTTS